MWKEREKGMNSFDNYKTTSTLKNYYSIKKEVEIPGR
jgi:hypothetical protein